LSASATSGGNTLRAVPAGACWAGRNNATPIVAVSATSWELTGNRAEAELAQLRAELSRLRGPSASETD
jgi:hypothetical protein